MRDLISGLALCLLFLSRLNAAEQSPAEMKLREALRNTTLQLRSAQGERDALQAEKTQWQQEKSSLASQLETATKQAAADQDAASQKLAALEGQAAKQTAEIARLQQSLEQWKASQQQASALATSREAERSRMAMHAIELQRRVDDQQAKNLAMYQIATEILRRYQDFGLGTALAAREPFVGATRVKLENLIQDYQDKLLDQRLRAESSKPQPASPDKKPGSAPARPAATKG